MCDSGGEVSIYWYWGTGWRQKGFIQTWETLVSLKDWTEKRALPKEVSVYLVSKYPLCLLA